MRASKAVLYGVIFPAELSKLELDLAEVAVLKIRVLEALIH